MNPKEIEARIDAAGIMPRLDTLAELAQRWDNGARFDAETGPLFAANLRHTFTKVQERRYPTLAAAEGEILPIEPVDPAAREWEYYALEGFGGAAWVGDDGDSATANGVKATRHTGECHEMQTNYKVSIFEMEAYGAQGRLGPVVIPIVKTEEDNAKRAQMAKTNWCWLFGDLDKNLQGLCNGPHIQVLLAAAKATPGGVREWDKNATNEEILADVEALVASVPEETLEQYHGKTLLIPHKLWRLLRARRLGDGDGFASLLDMIKDRYAGDESGQGKITLKPMIECDKDRRRNPDTGTDTSAISGDFLLLIPDAPTDELSFVRARPYTQRPPQLDGLHTKHYAHSKIGGCKNQIPRAVARMDFANG